LPGAAPYVFEGACGFWFCSRFVCNAKVDGFAALVADRVVKRFAHFFENIYLIFFGISQIPDDSTI